jgi:hypothetical protein
MAKKSYYREIEKLSETWEAVSNTFFSGFEIGRDWIAGNIFCVGSGGAYCLAKLWEMVHESNKFGLAQTITPFEFLHKQSNPDLVVLFSASGKNHDILQAFKVAISRNINVLVFTATEKSPLVRLARSNPLQAKAIFPEATIPKDGFLAVNSTIAVSCLILQFERYLLGKNKTLVSPVQIAVEDHMKSMVDSQDISGKTVQIIVADWGAAAGFDLEARFAESGLAPCFLTDPRNFAHGRFIWLEKWSSNTLLVLFFSNCSKTYINKFLKIIPKEVSRISVYFQEDGIMGAIYCLTRSILMFAEFARSSGTDPGMPFVPEWGKKLHRLKYTSCEVDLKKSSLSKSKLNIMPTFQVLFEGIVLDFDGTVVNTSDRTKPVSKDVILEFERLLKDGMKLGIATGRGKSAYYALKEQINPKYHGSIYVGLYNGTIINRLSNDLIPNTLNWSLKSIIDKLIKKAEIDPTKVSSRNTQISVTNISKTDGESLINFIKLHLGVDARFVKFCVSAHSLDILPHWASKILLVHELSTSPSSRFLCIGDQGQIGGNDEELLTRLPAVCVGAKQPASNECLWLGRNKLYREAAGTLIILKNIVKENDLFRLSAFNFGERYEDRSC